MTACLSLLREEVLKRAGEVVQAIGDELMCRFANAQTACAAAIAMQERISARDLASPLPIKIRIGLQWGEALREGNNLYGDAVNTAARLAHVAQGGQIMTSECVIRQAMETVGDGWREIGALPLKGKAAPLRVCEILWQAQAGDRLPCCHQDYAPPEQPSSAPPRLRGRPDQPGFRRPLSPSAGIGKTLW